MNTRLNFYEKSFEPNHNLLCLMTENKSLGYSNRILFFYASFYVYFFTVLIAILCSVPLCYGT